MKKPSWKSDFWLETVVANGKMTEQEAKEIFEQQRAYEKARREAQHKGQPEPTPEEIATLEESIAEHGAVSAIAVDQFGIPIEGKYRKAACRKLRVKCPTIVVTIHSEEQRRRMARALQYVRKRRGIDQLQQEIDEELLRDCGRTDRVIARELGTTHPTVAKRRRQLERSGKITTPQIVLGKENKLYTRKPTVVLTSSGACEKRAQGALQALGDKAPAGLVPVRTLERLARQHRRAQDVTAAAQRGALLPVEERYKLYHCRMQDMLAKGYIQPRSVSLLLTDPLYGHQHFGDWSDLADFAAEVLLDNGLLVAYCGDEVPEYIDRLRRRLTWVAPGAVVWAGGMARVAHRGNLFMGFRPVVIFVKGELRKCYATQPERRRLLPNCVHVGRSERDRHEYQQELAGFLHWVRFLSFPGELVCDSFLGSGTAAVATKLVGEARCFVGCDEVEEHVLGAREWLSQVGEGSAPQAGGV